MKEIPVCSEVDLKRHERRRKQRELLDEKKRQGKHYPHASLPNRKSRLKTPEEEQQVIQQTTEERLKVYRILIPGLLNKRGRIPDPRNPKKIKHQMTVLMLYGIFMFVCQMASRRNSNLELTTPQFIENLKTIFPELEDMPHQDTLCRLLMEIDVDQIEQGYIDLLRGLIRKKTFRNLLHKKRYLVAVDGTQKYTMDECWDERYLRRTVRGKEGEEATYQYYAYVLEAVLIFRNGMVLPLMSVFLENTAELAAIEKEEDWKQDCELKAFYRLSEKLKQAFPKLPMTLLMDGLYAKGPVMAICRRNKWQFMIVLKAGALSTVWEEVSGLMRLDSEDKPDTEDKPVHEQIWRGRQQTFRWVNELVYDYGTSKRKVLILHVVTCQESWEEMDAKTNEQVTKTALHAWISSEPVSKNNVHRLCNLAARKRWLHENNILKEKHQGYHYEHIFAYDWHAMRGYHYLMHIARMLNELVVYSLSLADEVKEEGVTSFVRKFREHMSGNWLNTERLRQIPASSHQLRLVC